MAMDSKIEWCDHTVNAWIGCAKVSAGCANCYADALDARLRFGKKAAGRLLDGVTHDGRPDAPVAVPRG